ncbi:MAG: glycosyltransferase family 2 protein [Acidobacteriia bacterium]|nr:glycosyltransferase family 2 protein [Terriglobia bacterium]
MDRSLPAAQAQFPVPGSSIPEVSIIVPARNEEASLGDCLASLTAQTGANFEIIVVDDGSTDRTREIAQSFAGVRVIAPGPLPAGWTGKNNAVVAGAREAAGRWLLFTDADTVHVLGSLARALAEANENKAELLSYSPEQIAVTFWEMAVLPVVFAELARQYPPQKVCDPASPLAAANGQYILIRRETYDAVGGHAAIADSLLEDVALASAVKRAGRRIRFRYAADMVRTRMYRNLRQLREGWTKNLALLFPNPGQLAVRLFLWWGIAWGFAFFSVIAWVAAHVAERFGFVSAGQTLFRWSGLVRSGWWSPLFLVLVMPLFMRLSRANFGWDMEALGAVFGMPMFSYLLLRSKKAHAKGQVSWKGRAYSIGTQREDIPDAMQPAKQIPRIEEHKLRTDS